MSAEDKTVKSIVTKTALAILCIAALGACGKKKGNSAVATAAGYQICPATGINPYTQAYCQPGTQIYVGAGAGATTCPATGINPYTQQYCQPGTMIYGQQQIGYQQQYGQQYGYQQNGCSMYQQMYGVPYYPQMTQYGLMCVRAY